MQVSVIIFTLFIFIGDKLLLPCFYFYSSCSKCLPSIKSRGKSRIPRIPLAALVNGYFKGPVPNCITQLNHIERSMINPYSTQTTVIIAGGKFHSKIGATFNLVNDIARTASLMPVYPTISSIAILRHVGVSQTKDYHYRPKLVRDALSWLYKNNPVFKDIKLDDTFMNSESLDLVEIDTFSLSKDENDALSGGNDIENNTSSNSGGRGEGIVLLTNHNDEITSHESQLLNALNGIDGVPVLVRESTNKFVNAYYNNEMFWEKTNVPIFPFGKGGPSDKHPYGSLTMAQFHRHSLMQGPNDRRRCQSFPLYIFLAYETEMKRKVGSVAVQASNLCVSAANPNGVITTEDIDDVREYLVRGLTQANLDATTSSLEQEKKIKKLMSLMMPFSKPLDGTPIMLAYERKKLLCLLNAPAVTTEGQWRWFLTFAMADLYDMKLFDILDGMRIASSEDDLRFRDLQWTKSRRLEELRNHPALAARIFAIKQQCIFDYLIGGSARPFNAIIDVWRRVEFQSRGSPHSHNIVS